MNEFVAEPRIALWIEYGPKPVDEMRHATDGPGVRMIGHPDVDLMAKIDVEGNEVGAHRSDIGWQGADSDAEIDSVSVSDACVCSQRDDVFNVWNLQYALKRAFLNLRSFLIYEAMLPEIV